MTTHQGRAVDALQALFKVENLDLRMGDVQVATDLCFEVYPGEMVAILGRNGVGKSTLLSCLAGLPRGVLSGDILLGGQSYQVLGDRAAACWRGWLAQKQQDQFSATVLETVISGRHPHLNRWAWESADDQTLAVAALTALDAPDRAERP